MAGEARGRPCSSPLTSRVLRNIRGGSPASRPGAYRSPSVRRSAVDAFSPVAVATPTRAAPIRSTPSTTTVGWASRSRAVSIAGVRSSTDLGKFAMRDSGTDTSEPVVNLLSGRATPSRPPASLSAKPIQLIRYRFGLPPCQEPAGCGSLSEPKIHNRLSARGNAGRSLSSSSTAVSAVALRKPVNAVSMMISCCDYACQW